MRTRVPLLALIALSLCANTACRRSADAYNLATVDSLLLVTDSLIKGMDALDLASVDRIDSLFALRRDALNNLMRDTLTKEEALALGNYTRTMTKTIARLRKEHGPVRAALIESRSKLADLRNDIGKGLLEAPVEAKYISDERIILARTRQNAEVVASGVQRVGLDHGRYGPTVDSIIAAHASTPTP